MPGRWGVHMTSTLCKLGGQYRAICACGWSGTWIQVEGALLLAEAEGRNHEEAS